MKMTLSAHCNITNPISLGYPVIESIKSFSNFCDEVIIVDGGSTDNSIEEISKIDKVRIIQGEKWNKDFDWKIIGRNLQIGYEECKGDWAFHFDVDYIFHEKYIEGLIKLIDSCNFPAIELRKINSVLLDTMFVKGNFPLLVNKREFKNVGYGMGILKNGNESATFLNPILKERKREDGMYEGMIIKKNYCRTEITNIPVYCYDFAFMTKEQIVNNKNRFDNSLSKFLNKGGKTTKEKTFEDFINMMNYRYKICKNDGIKMKIEDHSKFIKDKIINIKSSQFAYNGFDEIKQ